MSQKNEFFMPTFMSVVHLDAVQDVALTQISATIRDFAKNVLMAITYWRMLKKYK